MGCILEEAIEEATLSMLVYRALGTVDDQVQSPFARCWHPGLVLPRALRTRHTGSHTSWTSLLHTQDAVGSLRRMSAPNGMVVEDAACAPSRRLHAVLRPSSW